MTKPHAEILVRILDKVKNKTSANQGFTLHILALYYSSKKDTIQTIATGLEAVRVRQEVLGEKHPDYFKSLHNLAMYYDESGDTEKAIDMGEKLIPLRREVEGNTISVAQTLGNLALHYSKRGNYEKAIETVSEAIQICFGVAGETNPDYYAYLGDLARYYKNSKQYAKAVEIAQLRVEIQKKNKGEKHIDYAYALWTLGYYYKQNQEYRKAIEVETLSAQLIAEIKGKESEDYMNILENLSLSYTNLQEYGRAIEIDEEVLALRRKIPLQNMIGLLRGIAHDYLNYGNLDRAEELAWEAHNMALQQYGEKSEITVWTLQTLSVIFNYKEKYLDAIEHLQNALNIYKEVLGEKQSYDWLLMSLAIYYKQMGNNEKAVEMATYSADLTKKEYGEKSREYIDTLDRLINIYLNWDNNKMFEKSLEAYEIAKEILPKRDGLYKKVIHSLAVAYGHVGDYEKTLEYIEEAIAIHKELYATMDNACQQMILTVCWSAGQLAARKGRTDLFPRAIEAGKEALELFEKLRGKNSISYAGILTQLRRNYMYSGDVKNAANLHKQELDLIRQGVSNQFREMTTREREDFWTSKQREVAQLNLFCFQSNGLPLYQELAYDGAIFSKGLLLNSDIELNKLLLESGDKTLLATYEQLKSFRGKLKKIYEMSPDNRPVHTDSLEQAATRMERELVKNSRTYGDYTRNLMLRWQDVRNNLGVSDLAIEFVDFYPNFFNNKIYERTYAALLLKKNWEHPKMIRLFQKGELDSLVLGGTSLLFKNADMERHQNLIYETPALGDLIWSPLAEYLTGVQNIYFAPSGVLHNLAIEYLPTSNGNIRERFKLCRLSSTRQLAINSPVARQEKTVLYGGLDYNSALAGVTHAVQEEASSRNVNREVISELKRSGIAAKPLPGTQREVEQIRDAWSKKRIRPAVFTGMNGTEASFKMLSGQKTQILHIATHGFYLPEKEMPESFQFLTAGLDGKTATEDRSLSRSGLLMAGANTVLTGETILDGADDGILTAKEIAQLDLRGLDLVVLSACQTGLGEVTGEGVFGLQRGFKKAGAQTLLMSLWSVNDQATKIMMTRFYDYLLAGKSKREAFLSAQNDLRNHEEEVTYEREDRSQAPIFDARRGIRVYPKILVKEKRKIFDKPQYWAAFILLD